MAATAFTRPRLIYSCYAHRTRENESFVAEHVMTHVLAGTMTFRTSGSPMVCEEGDTVLIKRNQLTKVMKRPPENGEFRSISIFFDQDTLRNFSMEYNTTAGQPYEGPSIVKLTADTLTNTYMASIVPYLHAEGINTDMLAGLKAKEAILLLLRLDPQLKNLLFDFSEPGKIDLEAYMNKHFNFNVEMKRFAYLTGRSLATFKRDFEKIFHTSPNRWLQQKRLNEAYYLIREKGKKPSEVYLEVGFEDFSHFSYAFKKAFGTPPSLV
jgi:AraC-like DNA-binding protein